MARLAILMEDASAIGFLAGNDPRLNAPAGVYGESSYQGVMGVGNGSGTGVFGTGNYGIRGEAEDGLAAVQGQSFGSAYAGQFLGNVRVTGDIIIETAIEAKGNLHVVGNVQVDGDIFLKNSDICERFSASQAAHPVGSVMVAGDDGSLNSCTLPCDKRVVGIISGAGALKPAITLGAQSGRPSEAPIALCGTAFCLVDADFAPIEIGDLLTTSATPGHGMKAGDHKSCFGAILGKALAPIQKGKGLIPVVVALA